MNELDRPRNGTLGGCHCARRRASCAAATGGGRFSVDRLPSGKSWPRRRGGAL